MSATSELRTSDPGDVANRTEGSSRTTAGLRPLLVASMHQDARLIAPWVVGITVLSISSILAYNILFGDPATQAQFIQSVGANPALNLVFGPARDLSTVDGFTAWRSQALGGLFAGLMAILIVTRNSRANEDSGQAELIASGVVGRSTRLAVAVAMATIASFAAGGLAALLTIAFGGGVVASISLGATFTAAGLMFAGVAAVTAQLGSDSRAAGSMAIGTLGACYLIRGYVDTADPDGWAVWLSPLGWTEQVAPSTANNWWPLLACLALALALVAIGFRLQNIRDFGQGLIASRPGPGRGRLVASIWGLAIRLNRSAVITWTIGLTIIGAVFGSLSTTMIEVVETNPAVAHVLAAGATTKSELSFGLLITLINLVVIIAALYGIGIANRVYSEEVAFRVEPLLAGSLTRFKYLASNVVVALVGSAVAVMAAVFAMSLVAAPANDSVTVGALLLQGLVAIPALWLLVGVSLAAIGAKPKVRLIAWFGVVATFGLTLLGPSFNLPDWALGISPLWHIPNLKSSDPDFGGLIAISLIATALLVVSFVGFRRRDVL